MAISAIAICKTSLNSMP